MKEQDFRQLLEFPYQPSRISAKELPDWETDRTLLLADGPDDTTLHVWLRDGNLERARFFNSRCEWQTYYYSRNLSVRLLTSSGPIYPESSDYDFIKLLRSRGDSLLAFHHYKHEAEIARAKNWAPYSFRTPSISARGVCDE